MISRSWSEVLLYLHWKTSLYKSDVRWRVITNGMLSNQRKNVNWGSITGTEKLNGLRIITVTLEEWWLHGKLIVCLFTPLTWKLAWSFVNVQLVDTGGFVFTTRYSYEMFCKSIYYCPERYCFGLLTICFVYVRTGKFHVLLTCSYSYQAVELKNKNRKLLQYP